MYITSTSSNYSSKNMYETKWTLGFSFFYHVIKCFMLIDPYIIDIFKLSYNYIILILFFGIKNNYKNGKPLPYNITTLKLFLDIT